MYCGVNERLNRRATDLDPVLILRSDRNRLHSRCIIQIPDVDRLLACGTQDRSLLAFHAFMIDSRSKGQALRWRRDGSIPAQMASRQLCPFRGPVVIGVKVKVRIAVRPRPGSQVWTFIWRRDRMGRTIHSKLGPPN